METLTKDTMKLLRAEISVALQRIAKDRGLAELTVGRGTYDPLNGSFKFQLTGLVGGGLSPDAARYNDYRRQVAPHFPALGMTFYFDGRLFEVTGMNMTRTKVFAADVKTRKPYTIRLPGMERTFPAPGQKAVRSTSESGFTGDAP